MSGNSGSACSNMKRSKPKDLRILIVDDEKRILETFSLLLQEFGYSITTSSEPGHALDLVANSGFEIVFLDQFLGKINGTELMREMSSLNPDLSFVIISANGSTDLAVRCLKEGAADFISKPFFTSDLIKSIDYVNKKRELERDKKEFVERLASKLEKKTEELRQVYFRVLSSLAQAMEKKDIGTYGHSMRVKQYSGLIAAALDLTEEDRQNLKSAAMLHDIGKIGTSDFILGKPGPLDQHEIKVVRTHPQKGVDILKPLKKNFPQLESILPAILHHHESYDGSGYPAGLSGENIPLLARIIAVADTYDAILSNRPYRSAANQRKAIDELSKNAGLQFDPRIVGAFITACGKYEGLFGNTDAYHM